MYFENLVTILHFSNYTLLRETSSFKVNRIIYTQFFEVLDNVLYCSASFFLLIIVIF